MLAHLARRRLTCQSANDWKTDDVSPAEVAGRLKEYKLQAGI